MFLAMTSSAHVFNNRDTDEAAEFIEDPIGSFIKSDLKGLDKGLILSNIYDHFMQAQLGLFQKAQMERYKRDGGIKNHGKFPFEIV